MSSTSFRVAALAAATALVLSACGGDDGGDDDTGAPAGDGGSDSTTDAGAGGGEGITIGIKYDQPGLGLMEGSEPSGMDVDVAKAVAEKLGYSEDQITWAESVSAQRETLLETGQVDMIFATYSITDARKEKVQFAGPYFVAGQDLLVAADSDITGPDDLDGRLLCSVTGSTSAENVKEDVPGVQLQEYASYSECMEQLAGGTIEALTTDDTILAGFAAQDQYAGQFKVVGAPFSEELYGVGLPKESEDCEAINEAINELWEDGTMEQIVEDNLGAAGYTPNADLNPPEAGGHCG
jgi:glutamate transport system substrate-binding protein